MEQFNGQRLGFGKVLKQIKCQVVDFTSNESVSKEVYFDNGFHVQKLPLSAFEAVSNADVVEEEDAFLDSWEEPDDSDSEIDETQVEEEEQNPISSSIESPPIELRSDSRTEFKSQKQVVKGEIREIEEIETPLVSFQVNKSEEAVAETRLNDEIERPDVEEVDEENLEPLNSSIASSEEERIDRIRKLEQKLLGKEKLLGGGADSDQPEAKAAKVEEKKKKKKKIIVKGHAKKGSKIEIPGSSKR